MASQYNIFNISLLLNDDRINQITIQCQYFYFSFNGILTLLKYV